MNKNDEMILAVTTKELFRFNEIFQGLETDKDIVDFLMGVIGNNYCPLRRGDAEEDPTYKQIIPYVIIRRGNEVFTYQRLELSGEKRLHGNYSIGFGGHMNPIEGEEDFEKILVTNMKREVDEELIIDEDADVEDFGIVGFINDDSNDVGTVHIGILLEVVFGEDTEIEVRETEQLEGEWVTVEQLHEPEYFNQLENWSKLALEVL